MFEETCQQKAQKKELTFCAFYESWKLTRKKI